jgi:hypothetical protein
MKAATHGGVARGKRVLVRLVDGTKFIDRFIDRTRVQLVFATRRIARKDIKSMTIYRALQYTWIESRYGTINLEHAAEFPNQCPNVDASSVLCSQPLNGNGECPQHGKIRLRPREKVEEPKPEPPRIYGRRRWRKRR